MGHDHGHHEFGSTKKLYLAVVINIILTVFQIVGGLLSGSLSLLADALHNFSDAGALAIAAIAAKIAKIPPNQRMTYGYKRAEILGALINSTTLIIVGLYLLYEAVNRYFDQNPIDGWTVVWVATIALVIDIFTALLTYSGSKDNVNIKAAFIHNVSDAAASVVVIFSGILILYFKVYLVDLIATVLISIYVLFQAFFLIRQCILVLMQSTPNHLDINEIKSAIESVSLVKEAHHIHVWQLDDKKILLETHVVVFKESLYEIENIKKQIRHVLSVNFSIKHSTLEFEISENCQNL
ncbi:MAG TPA: cation transporter [Bdellovibrionales bacterium]|nr:cation transporter [Pseudobdellovibrionaceae bacterium]HAG91865.1 cation transporter [Bdellovibrionales bacterium]